MSDERERKRRRGRVATTAAILDAAAELFSERGYSAVSVRDIAERAGVTHALVHQYVGSKDEVFRAVLKRGEGVLASPATDNQDLLESTSLMLRGGLEEPGRAHARLLVGSALGACPTIALPVASRLSNGSSSSPSGRRDPHLRPSEAEKDLDPRLVVACVGSLFLGRVAVESWMRPARSPGHGRGRACRWARAGDPQHPEGPRARRRS